MRMTRWLWAAPLITILAGCTPPPPKGYVRVDPSYGYAYRAVSAEGSALTMRTEANPENGDLAFWEKVVTARLTDVRGYTLKDRREVTAGNVKGLELSFEYTREGTVYLYTLTVFVSGREVHVFEAAGEREKLTAALPALRQTIADWPTM